MGVNANSEALKYIQLGNKNSSISLVFLHGSTMTKEGMLPLAEMFPQFNCISFDLTAHGESKGQLPEEISDLSKAVETSISVLQDNKVIGEKIILLGYSMGGAIVFDIAKRKQIDLMGMVILSSGADLKNFTPLVDEIKNMPPEQFKTSDIVQYLFGKDTSEEERKKISDMFLQTKAKDLTGYNDLMISNAYNQLEKCSKITTPTLLIHGSDDTIVLPDAGIKTWKQIKDSELLILPYKGHAAIYEDTGVIKDKINEFVHCMDNQ
ncbi:MAG: alpha/beta hydrolase [Lachnospiraceae bacterium]|nr:alpha/beta hydrolase [Lachnospiraceae bacterium]